MNTISTKAIVIGVSIFITVAITSMIFISINQMREIYSDVYETDISISSGFSEFDEFDGTQKTGVDLLNALNKYINVENVHINVGIASNVNNQSQSYINENYDNESAYKRKYNCSINKSGDEITINFQEK